MSEFEPVRVSNEYEKFLREFIAVFKELPVLWDKRHPGYSNKTERNNGIEILLSKCKEYFPDVTYEFAKVKLETIRGCFRREYKKVVQSKEIANSPEEIYKPTLWYYSLLLFTVGENADYGDMEALQNYSKSSYWTREYTLILIDLLKSQPMFYSADSCKYSRSEKLLALKKIADGLLMETGKKFELMEIKRKITMLKDQYRRERRMMRIKKSKTSSLWCYEMLSFLKRNASMKTKTESKSTEALLDVTFDSVTSPPILEIQGIEENDTKNFDSVVGNVSNNMLVSNAKYNYNDIFDTIGKNVTRKLKDMLEDQRRYAINIINDILCHGSMNHLSWDLGLSIKYD